MGARRGGLDRRRHRHAEPRSPACRRSCASIIRIPREFVNDYIFNFPDTSFAWAFVLALLAAALAARKRIAWWILVAVHGGRDRSGTSVDLFTGGNTVIEDVGEAIGLVFHVAAIGFLVLARSEFWAKVRRGALFKAAATLVVGMAVGTPHRVGAARDVPRLARQRTTDFLYALNRVSALRRRRQADVLRPASRTSSSTHCSACSVRWRSWSPRSCCSSRSGPRTR